VGALAIQHRTSKHALFPPLRASRVRNERAVETLRGSEHSRRLNRQNAKTPEEGEKRREKREERREKREERGFAISARSRRRDDALRTSSVCNPGRSCRREDGFARVVVSTQSDGPRRQIRRGEPVRANPNLLSLFWRFGGLAVSPLSERPRRRGAVQLSSGRGLRRRRRFLAGFSPAALVPAAESSSPSMGSRSPRAAARSSTTSRRAG
jgi:hypothetical protein